MSSTVWMTISRHDDGGVTSSVTDVVARGPANATQENYDHFSLGDFLWIYVSPIIFLVGIVGNTLILMTMRSQSFSNTTTGVYLMRMAIADVCVLVTGIIPEWLEATHWCVLKETHPLVCKLEKFLHYTFGDLSIWLLVAFSLDRFVAVCLPLLKLSVCRARRARRASAVMLLLAVLKNVHVFWTRGRQIKDGVVRVCGRPTPAYEYFEFFVRPWIAFTLCSVIPFVVIAFCNVSILRSLVVAGRFQRHGTDSRLAHTALMCLSASLAFLVCLVPSIILLIGRPHWINYPSYDVVKAVNNQLVYVNHSCNFFLYCISGAKFRNELLRVIRRITNSNEESSSSDTPRPLVYRFNDKKGTAVPRQEETLL